MRYAGFCGGSGIAASIHTHSEHVYMNYERAQGKATVIRRSMYLFRTMSTTMVAMAALLSVCYGGLLERPVTTTTPPPTIMTGCHHNGQVYPPASTISRGSDRKNNYCYGTYCDYNNQVVQWDDWNCFPTTTPPTTIPPTTTPPGCVYRGRVYPFNSVISTGEDRAHNWCWSVHCGSYGEIMNGDDFNCFPTTPTTIPPTTIPPTTLGGPVVG